MVAMSAFTANEIEYLTTQMIGRMATVGPNGQPHVIPVTYFFNADEDALDIGGIHFADGKKWRDAQANPKVTFLIDDYAPDAGHGIEIRGQVELHETGGSKINPRFPNFVEQFFRLRPKRIVAWGLDEPEGDSWINARSVS